MWQYLFLENVPPFARSTELNEMTSTRFVWMRHCIDPLVSTKAWQKVVNEDLGRFSGGPGRLSCTWWMMSSFVINVTSSLCLDFDEVLEDPAANLFLVVRIVLLNGNNNFNSFLNCEAYLSDRHQKWRILFLADCGWYLTLALSPPLPVDKYWALIAPTPISLGMELMITCCWSSWRDWLAKDSTWTSKGICLIDVDEAKRWSFSWLQISSSHPSNAPYWLNAALLDLKEKFKLCVRFILFRII